jgi:hypothetical protein
VVNVSIKDQIRKLIELQEVDGEIYTLKKSLEEKPVYLAELKSRFEEKKATLKGLEEKAKTILLSRKAKEGDLQAKEEATIKANGQLSQLKTNKEYQAKITEIENIKADKSIIEEQILISYDEGDKVNAEVDKEKKLLAQEETTYLGEKSKIEEEVKGLQDKIKVLQNKRHQMTPGVDPANLAIYERILGKKEGVAIVPVRGSSCGGCYMNVTPQMLNEIKMHDRFVSCESCNRILYIEEDL